LLASLVWRAPVLVLRFQPFAVGALVAWSPSLDHCLWYGPCHVNPRPFPTRFPARAIPLAVEVLTLPIRGCSGSAQPHGSRSRLRGQPGAMGGWGGGQRQTAAPVQRPDQRPDRERCSHTRTNNAQSGPCIPSPDGRGLLARTGKASHICLSRVACRESHKMCRGRRHALRYHSRGGQRTCPQDAEKPAACESCN
jgi:hypothetical protein